MIDETPLISVIVPVYNVKPYLREALESVIQQTYQNLEIIIVDDGSTDGSGEICDEYLRKDSRIVVYHQQNLGLSNARNKALDIASGEIIAFLDSDDYFNLHMIQTMVSKMQKSNADIVICDFVWKGHKSNLRPGIYTRTDALKELINCRIDTAVWNKLYKRSLWKDIRFPDGYIFEGLRTTYKLLDKANKIYILPNQFIMHRNRQDSITNTRSLKNSLDALLAAEEFELFVRDHTPGIFSYIELNSFLERRVRGTIVHWIYVVKIDKAEADKLKKTIQMILKDIHILGIKTRVMIILFKYSPIILEFAIPLYLKIIKLRPDVWIKYNRAEK